MRIVITMLHVRLCEGEKKREKEKERERECMYIHCIFVPLFIERSFISISMHAYTLFSEHVKNFLQKQEYNANK